MKKLFRFPIFDRARRVGGTHSAMEGCGGCSRFTVSRHRALRVLDFRFPILVLVLTGALGASCGGDALRTAAP